MPSKAEDILKGFKLYPFFSVYVTALAIQLYVMFFLNI